MARRIMKAGGSSGAGQLVTRRVSKEETDTFLSFSLFFPGGRTLMRRCFWNGREGGEHGSGGQGPRVVG